MNVYHQDWQITIISPQWTACWCLKSPTHSTLLRTSRRPSAGWYQRKQSTASLVASQRYTRITSWTIIHVHPCLKFNTSYRRELCSNVHEIPLKWFVHAFSIVRIRCTQWHWSSRSNDTHKCCARCAVYMVIALNWAALVMMTCFNVVAARLVRQSRQTFEVLWCQGLSSPPPTPPLQRPIDQMNRDHLSCADVAVKRKHCCVLAI